MLICMTIVSLCTVWDAAFRMFTNQDVLHFESSVIKATEVHLPTQESKTQMCQLLIYHHCQIVAGAAPPSTASVVIWGNERIVRNVIVLQFHVSYGKRTMKVGVKLETLNTNDCCFYS